MQKGHADARAKSLHHILTRVMPEVTVFGRNVVIILTFFKDETTSSLFFVGECERF